MLLRKAFLIIFFGVAVTFLSEGRAGAQAGYGPHLTFNVQTGEVYSQRNAFDQWYPASLTKVMTAYTIFREIKRGKVTMKSPVRISDKALRMPPSKMGFPVGTVLTVENALRIISVKSANDVSLALAESVGGSEVQFVNLMNRYAREIGMERSSFANPHGLHDPDQYTTAYDMGLLTRRIYSEFPEHADLFAIHAIRVGKRTLRNHNALLRRLPGTIGFKTGFICAGGVSLIATRKSGDEIIASILMGERRARIRNLKVAEFLAAAENASAAKPLRFDEMAPPPMAKAPTDISDYVCGRKRSPASDLLFEDPAIEFFAVKRVSNNLDIEAREAAVYGATDSSPQPIRVELGGADGPDPYQLLVEKPPLLIAVSSEQITNRHDIGEGQIVATPTPRPDS